MGSKVGAEGRWHHAAVGSFEQQNAHLRLGILQGLGHGGLGHVQHVGGPEQIALGQNGGHKAQVANGQTLGDMGHGLT